MMVLSDNGKTSRYTYNHAGERIVKSHGTMEGVYINGAPQGITFHETDEYTLYPASIISVNKNRFTKHYFIGSKRIASRIGSGHFNNVYGMNGCNITAGQQDYAERLNQIESQKEDYYRELGIAPGIPTMKGSYGDPENTGVGYNTIIRNLGDHSVPAEWAEYVKKNENRETAPGAPIAWEKASQPEEVQPGYGFIPDNESSEETFYYHSDHLGSTSYITDDSARITQYTAYLPYGELLVDEHSSSEDLPYKFNGKELDEETGLYYYGARYMQPIASIWYGIDPLTEKYPEISGYVYCHGNPIIRIDADGKADKDNKWKTISSVIPKDKFVGWEVGGNCFKLSKKQIEVMGYTIGGANEPTNIYPYNENTGVNVTETQKAIKYISDALENKTPVVIGVDDAKGSPNMDKTTDHFLVVVGMGNDKRGNFFVVYDNATSDREEGTNSANKLYYDSKSKKITGRIPNSYSQDSPRPYVVSQVRVSKKKKNRR